MKGITSLGLIALMTIAAAMLTAPATAATATSADALKERIDRGEKLLIIDVREPDEVASGSVPHALNVPMSVLSQRMRDIPKDVSIVFICASGHRSARAAELFRKNGYAATSYCSIAEWNARRLPLEPAQTPPPGPIAPAEK